MASKGGPTITKGQKVACLLPLLQQQLERVATTAATTSTGRSGRCEEEECLQLQFGIGPWYLCQPLALSLFPSSILIHHDLHELLLIDLAILVQVELVDHCLPGVRERREGGREMLLRGA